MIGAKVELLAGERQGVRGRVVAGAPLPTGQVWAWFVGRTEPEIIDLADVKVVPEPKAPAALRALNRALGAVNSALEKRTKP